MWAASFVAVALGACSLDFPWPVEGSAPSDDAGATRDAETAEDATIEDAAIEVDAADADVTPDPCTVALADARGAVIAPPPGALPEKGVVVRAAGAGTCLRRITDALVDDPEIASANPTNADRTSIIVNENTYESWIWDLSSGEKTLRIGYAWEEHLWDATRPSRVSLLSREGSYAISDQDVVVAGSANEVARFEVGADLAPTFGDLDHLGSHTRGWSSADRDRVALLADDTAGTAGLATYERMDDTFRRVGLHTTTSAIVSWSRITPSGRFVVACWGRRGMFAYDFELTREVEIPNGTGSPCSSFSSAALELTNEHDAMVWSNDRAIRAVDLDLLMAGDTVAAEYPLEADFGLAPGTLVFVHLAAPENRPGWVAVFFRGCDECSPGSGWGQDKIVALEVQTADATRPARVYNLAWHRGTSRDTFAVDPDFRHVYFTSTWGAPPTDLHSIFEIDLGDSLPR
jgi:hypothetical protein